MSKRAKNATEIQILMERLQYLAGKILMTRSLLLPSEKEEMCLALGLRKRVSTDEKGKEKITYSYTEESCRLISDIYKRQYIQCAKKLDRFYKTLDCLQSEEIRFVCELRFVDGYSWKEIRRRINRSEQTCLSYRRIIVDVFKKENCSWALNYDALNL